MMKRVLLAGVMAATLGLGVAVALQAPGSPPAKATVTVGAATLTIDYSAPSVRGRKIFGPGGLISGDPTYPVWRAGANSATAFHTDADLTIGSGANALAVPKGDYTLFVDVSNPDAWTFVVNKQTGQWGLDYDKAQDLGRVPMTMSRPASPVEQLTYTLTGSGSNAATLQLAWDEHVASVPIAVK
jgi:hypothetical protein